MPRQGFGRTWLTAVLAAILIVTISGAAQAKRNPPGTFKYLASYGWEACPESVEYFLVDGPWATSTYSGDVTLGTFGRGGRVQGGQYAFAISVDFGTLPASRIEFPSVIDSETGSLGMYVTPSRPVATGIVNVAEGTTWGTLGSMLQTGYVTTLASGEGTAVVRLALLTRESQSWREVLGLTVSKTITIVTPSPLGTCVLDGTIIHNYETFTIGGAYVSTK